MVFISVYGFGQSNKNKGLRSELIGGWEFSELRDDKGNKVDTIWHNVPGLGKKGWEIPRGPLMVYNANGTYSKQFTPKNIDTGEWYYDEKKKEINQTLSYPKPYSAAAQYLIDKGHAKQDRNGSYYEVIIDKIVELTNDTLIILEREGRQRIFIKKK
ncbi:hypothetical protein GCM10011383_34320 [Hymenobacter cavernae]|uniref:Lipocalin-like domain-containing protein n=2 Tax=Hymenobacter cavernae TaxID=2044852 RepID=A0ABQ1UIG0_9BACT|nr:hypothetical protein GCM10011383_34320 [Hymenobacter cavernae]